jgi:hypothetical protein
MTPVGIAYFVRMHLYFSAALYINKMVRAVIKIKIKFFLFIVDIKNDHFVLIELQVLYSGKKCLYLSHSFIVLQHIAKNDHHASAVNFLGNMMQHIGYIGNRIYPRSIVHFFQLGIQIKQVCAWLILQHSASLSYPKKAHKPKHRAVF